MVRTYLWDHFLTQMRVIAKNPLSSGKALFLTMKCTLVDVVQKSLTTPVLEAIFRVIW